MLPEVSELLLFEDHPNVDARCIRVALKPDADADTLARRLAVDIADAPWKERARCRSWPDVNDWFPTRGRSTGNQCRVCASCPVREPCLAHALEDREQHGIWGGFSEKGRRRIRQRGMTAREAIEHYG